MWPDSGNDRVAGSTWVLRHTLRRRGSNGRNYQQLSLLGAHLPSAAATGMIERGNAGGRRASSTIAMGKSEQMVVLAELG